MLQKKRLNWVDWAKTFGIFLVVFGHSFNPSSSEWSWELELLNLIYSFHMPLFFFLSGYLFKVKETNFGDYLWGGGKIAYYSIRFPKCGGYDLLVTGYGITA